MKRLNSSSENTKLHAIKLFIMFIEYLKLYGHENYGLNVEIDYKKAYSLCMDYGMFDFNEDLENVVRCENEEEFRDRCYTYMDNLILNEDLPVWALYTNMSPWLKDKLNKEYSELQINKEKKYFKKCKCFHCKYFKQEITYFTKDGDFLSEYRDEKDLRGVTRDLTCLKREEIIDEKAKKKKISFLSERNSIKTGYKQFDRCIDTFMSTEYKHNPAYFFRCPYHEENNMTYEEYVAKYHDLVMYVKDE